MLDIHPFLISIVGLGQLGIYHWRAGVAATARAPISKHVGVVAGISTDSVGPRDFRTMLKAHDLTPHLSGPGGKFHAIRAYYFAVESLGRRVPWVTGWAEAEMTMCSRYLAVLLDQHLDRNMAWAVRMRGL